MAAIIELFCFCATVANTCHWFGLHKCALWSYCYCKWLLTLIPKRNNKSTLNWCSKFKWSFFSFRCSLAKTLSHSIISQNERVHCWNGKNCNLIFAAFFALVQLIRTCNFWQFSIKSLNIHWPGQQISRCNLMKSYCINTITEQRLWSRVAGCTLKRRIKFTFCRTLSCAVFDASVSMCSRRLFELHVEWKE